MSAIKKAVNNLPYNSELVVSASVGGMYNIANTDARTAFTAAQTLNTTTLTGSTVVWLMVPPGTTGLEVIARVPKTTTAVGTNPVLTLWGAIPTEVPSGTETTIIDANGNPTTGVYVRRLDATDPTAVGTATAYNASPTTSNTINDASYFYSPPIFTNTDLRGASWVAVIPTTGASITPSAAVEILVSFLN